MSDSDKVRLDRWLWAARFYKTRNLAKTAIDGGKVQIDGTKPKPSRALEVGMQLTIRQGWEEKTVEVTALSEQRRGAPQAALLYRETENSVAQREARATLRKLQADEGREGRPNKKQRRQIHRFKHISEQ